MKFRLIEKTLDAVTVEETTESEWVEVGPEGCDSIVFVVAVTESDTPVGAGLQLQGSIDQTNVVDIGSPVAVTEDGVLSIEKDRPVFNYYRLSYEIDTGSYLVNTTVLAKGDKE